MRKQYDVDWGTELRHMEQTLRRIRGWLESLDDEPADELPPLVNKRERNLEIFRLVDAGNTVKSVAARYELSLTQVYTIVRETGECLASARANGGAEAAA